MKDPNLEQKRIDYNNQAHLLARQHSNSFNYELSLVGKTGLTGSELGQIRLREADKAENTY
ncbi:hypothetical protein BHYA_0295g00140 [Botrytis hyacinthi]|uniref:Uncharacterized protein n=1 Tax=Botrytis hyacinthi TaxID=278943 RepID=A0A4Z1G6W2_9HELO|nr:hypothetical protein BHYA_0295g00140 [Botrytis hyacinthi]